MRFSLFYKLVVIMAIGFSMDLANLRFAACQETATQNAGNNNPSVNLSIQNQGSLGDQPNAQRQTPSQEGSKPLDQGKSQDQSQQPDQENILDQTLLQEQLMPQNIINDTRLNRLRLLDKEKMVKDNIENRMQMLLIDREVPVFGMSYYEIKGATRAEQYIRTQALTSDYSLGVGDGLIIHIRGIRNEDISATVSNYGTVALPDSAPQYVLGKPLSVVSEQIKSVLLEKFKNVSIEVDIASIRSFNVYIVGEVMRPGSYLVTGLNTVMDLLSMSGGPTEKGSFRNIEIHRLKRSHDPNVPPDEQIQSEIHLLDLYKIFIDGDESEDIRLESGDRIIIPPVGVSVKIMGKVKRPARYELVRETNLERLMKLCGGFDTGAYLKRLEVRRINQSGFVNTSEINYEDPEAKNFPLLDGDEIAVYSGLDVLKGFVSIEGNVWFPKDYSLKKDMKLSDLIAVAGGCMPDTYLERVDIFRYISKENRNLIRVPLQENNLPDPKDDLLLMDWDIVKVYNIFDVLPLPVAGVEGAIAQEGLYPIREGMRVLDLIVQAGGLTFDANSRRAELLRINPEGQTIRLEIPLDVINQNPSGEENIPLQRDDRLIILRRVDMYAFNEVYLRGEVKKPGTYKISQGEKISSVIAKANGLTQNAYLAKAELYRVDNEGNVIHKMVDLNKALQNPMSEFNIPLFDRDSINVLKSSPIEAGWHVSVSGAVASPTTYPIVQGTSIRDIIMKAGGLTKEAYEVSAELTRFDSNKEITILEIDLVDILKNPGSKTNFTLQDMDRIHVFDNPDNKKTIRVGISGEVILAGTFTLKAGSPLSEILQRAGGLRPEAYKTGLILQRESIKSQESFIREELQQSQERELLRMQEQLVESAITNEDKQMQLRILDMRQRILSITGKQHIDGRFMFDPSKDDPILEDGDQITVPTLPKSVLIVGAVYGAGAVIYDSDSTYEEYIKRVGGITPYADEKQIYIIKPNGYVERKNESSNPILPGDIIVIPPRVDENFQAAGKDSSQG